MPSQSRNDRFFCKGSEPTTIRLLSLMFVPLKFKLSSEVNDERHANRSAVIELQQYKSSLVSRRCSSLMFVLHKKNTSSEVDDERHANPSAVIELQSRKSSLVSRVKEIEIATIDARREQQGARLLGLVCPRSRVTPCSSAREAYQRQ